MSSATVDILGVAIHCVDFAQTLDLMAKWIADADPSHSGARQICTVNPEFIMAAQHDPAFARVLAAADLALAEVMAPDQR